MGHPHNKGLQRGCAKPPASERNKKLVSVRALQLTFIISLLT